MITCLGVPTHLIPMPNLGAQARVSRPPTSYETSSYETPPILPRRPDMSLIGVFQQPATAAALTVKHLLRGASNS
jgi:hypothetical protein